MPRWLVPVRPHGVVLESQALALCDDIIVDYLPEHEAINRWPDACQVHLPDHVLLPGLVNAHTHAAMTLLRGFADDLRLQTWLHDHVWPTESRWVSEEFVRDGTELAALEMLRGGVTCFNDMYFFPGAAAEASTAAGMRAMLGMIVIDVPTAFAANAENYFSRGEEFCQQWSKHPLMTVSLAPHSAFSLDNQQFERVIGLAHDLDARIHMHVHETEWELSESVANHGMRPMQRLDQLGLLTPRLLAVHMTHLSAAEINSVAENGVHVVHCPESNLKLASGFCPVVELRRAGINVCVGTDGAASNNDLDVLAEARIAALLAKGFSADPETINAAEALDLVTINGATALGLGDQIGSLESGKQADLCAIDMSYPETQPVHDVISQIIYAAGRNQVTDVWVAGKRLMEGRELRSLDEADILAKAEHWRRKIQQTDSQ
jgi:5-methylthioadenosine/S-adenosylhomocysteine deaminase